MLRAQKSILIVGWDIDSRTRLVGKSGQADDGFPEALVEFLSALVQRRPGLVVRLLLWNYSVLYALEREILPALSLNWSTPDQVRFCLDDRAPLGCSQHQKIVVVDDQIAYSGGLDLTIRRWDTSDHELQNPHRIDPSGEPYRPFHDVQAIVDGEAARALAELARERWREADGSRPSAVETDHDCWPSCVAPHFSNVQVGISRTLPGCNDQPPIREVEKLFFDSIAAAERMLYIENQFLTLEDIAHGIVRRMKERPALEVVIVSPDTPDSWVETRTMRNGRIRFRNILKAGRIDEQWRLVAPEVTDGETTASTMVHSKVMIVDDHLLRVGSANLNNRSMGADSECDLVIEARSDADRAAIIRIRNTLLGEHCGVGYADIAALLAKQGSIIDVVDRTSARGHRLRMIDDGGADAQDIAHYMEELADPRRPWEWSTLYGWITRNMPSIRSLPTAKFLILALVLLGLTLAWYYSPLADYARPGVVQSALADFRSSGWGPIIALGAFLVGGLIAFPVTILIAATVATFGPWFGLLYAASGAMASAAVVYGIGAWLGRDSLRNFLGTRLDQVRKRIVRQGVVAIAAVRLVPVAPFTVVNLVAGASGIGFKEYLVGTLLGLAPGLVAMAVFGAQIMRTLSSPTVVDVLLLVVGLIVWVGFAFAIQAAISNYQKES